MLWAAKSCLPIDLNKVTIPATRDSSRTFTFCLHTNMVPLGPPLYGGGSSSPLRTIPPTFLNSFLIKHNYFSDCHAPILPSSPCEIKKLLGCDLSSDSSYSSQTLSPPPAQDPSTASLCTLHTGGIIVSFVVGSLMRF